ncbi:hypothetical protein BO83DRAFT_402559 [Aspergillus eucalypticola CBS 122712]|uniref:Exonuclease domain-containing protein n=1 Tax=Aspergillus eucalypticola (strain CBS 122712 / IBT 29274) TaxID=1448314 RepID=A0A317UR65_ASPEC|nr:uncharacterized protein BO83DRAFT_402559 [Aspergillus eucalypticola CBS 122712]PWY64454.1 hypothetical protein BO83DRAFT_402559 [Aspergillus eucalypticola CBS 122712]
MQGRHCATAPGYLRDQRCPLPLRRLGLHAPQTSFLKTIPDIDIGFTTAPVAQHNAYKFSVGHGVLPLLRTEPDEAKTGNQVASVSVEHRKECTPSGSYEPVVPEVPTSWSSILSSERDVVLDALQSQCHPIACLAGERYWTQTPSPVDIDMTRKCRNCGGIIRGRGTGVPKNARCVNCKQLGSSKGCTVFSAHEFAAPDAKLGEMAPTPAYNRAARKAVVLDCEMVGVLGADGRECSEVVRLSAVDFLSRELIIDTYVSPQGHVISWRTKFSGVNPSVLAEKTREGKLIKGWRAARDLLWQFIDARTVLIGHSLNNDLAVLGMIHTRIVDSAIMTRVAVGEDCQRHWALKTLCHQLLDREIQAGNDGHDCVEDTYAAREVILWCLRNAFKLQAWAAEERRIIAEKYKKKEVLVTKAIEVASIH